jgi:hypothetical protein
VSYPNKKPAVQTKKPKKYARKAPSLVPLRRPMMKGEFVTHPAGSVQELDVKWEKKRK